MAIATESRQTTTESMREEAVFISGPRRGQIVNLSVTSDGAFQVSEPELTPEEMEVLEAVVEASKKAEATAIRAGKTAERVIERMQRLREEMRGENA